MPQPQRQPPPPPTGIAPFQCPPRPAVDNVQSTLPGVYGPKPSGNGRHRIIVDVADYATLAPLPGVTVNLAHESGPCTRDGGCTPLHPAHPQRATSVTDATGRIVFDVPDLLYQLAIPPGSTPGYLDFSSTYALGKKQCHDLLMQGTGQGSGTRYFIAFLVPETMLSVKARDQAIAAARANPEIRAWLRTHSQYQLHIQGGPPSSPTMWRVGWGTPDRMKRLVYVNAFDGDARVGGRWTD